MRGWDQNGSWGDWLAVEWIQVAQDMDRWLAIVNTAMNHRVLTPRGWLVSYLGIPSTLIVFRRYRTEF
jgi:hypothetical protein